MNVAASNANVLHSLLATLLELENTMHDLISFGFSHRGAEQAREYSTGHPLRTSVNED